MKTRIFPRPLLAIASLTALALSAMPVGAQNVPISTATPNTVQTPASSQPDPVALSFGVPEILKLARAHVSDDTIVAFIGNSGRTYNLTASEVVYLHDQGVSERVITTMLIQRRNAEETSTPPTPPAQQAPAASAMAAPAQSSATYVQTPPAYAPSSTVYVVPSSSPTYAYYGGYPYYGGYYGYSYPAVSLAFGFGFGSYYGSSWHGGGNWGWHGGGSSHWGGSQGGGSHWGGGMMGGGGSHGGHH